MSTYDQVADKLIKEFLKMVKLLAIEYCKAKNDRLKVVTKTNIQTLSIEYVGIKCIQNHIDPVHFVEVAVANIVDPKSFGEANNDCAKEIRVFIVSRLLDSIQSDNEITYR
jgi:hypothetical protein